MKRPDPVPVSERCGHTKCVWRATHFVIVRAAVTVDMQLCTRHMHIILRKHPASEAAEMIETKRGAN